MPKPEPEHATHAVGRLGGPPLMVLPAVALVLVSLAIAAGVGPLFDLSQRAALDLLAPADYLEAVLG